MYYIGLIRFPVKNSLSSKRCLPIYPSLPITAGILTTNRKRYGTLLGGFTPNPKASRQVTYHQWTTAEDFCMKTHKNLIKEFKNALVWGLSVKQNPQKEGKDIFQIVEKWLLPISSSARPTTPALPMTSTLAPVLSGFGSHWIRIQGREREVLKLEFHLLYLVVTLYIGLY